MTRCPKCNLVISEKHCSQCPPMIIVECPRCGAFIEVRNTKMEVNVNG